MIRNDDWKVRLEHRLDSFLVEVFIYRKLDGGMIDVVKEIKEDGEVIAQTLPIHEVTNPTMLIPHDMAQSLIQAFATEGKRFGIPSSSEDMMRGQLGATEKHLEDMRRLVFDEDREAKTVINGSNHNLNVNNN